MTYFRNLWLWIMGFTKLGSVALKVGWNVWTFAALYLVDYGFNVVVLAGRVESVSRYCFDRRTSQPWKALGTLLDRIQPRHIESAGPPLWGSQENAGIVRIVVPALWLLALLLV